MLGLVVISFAIPHAWRLWQERRTDSWPTAEAKIQTWKIVEPTTIEYSVSVPRVEFSYKVQDRSYEGVYQEKFYSRPDAEQLLRSMKNGPLLVRYDRNNPASNLMTSYVNPAGPPSPVR
jgi:hypothetical protein